MNEDQLAGAAKDMGGSVKRAAGDLMGDTKTQVEGTIDQLTGSAQRTYGKMKNQASSASNAMADQLDDASAFLGDTVAERPLTALLIAGAIGYTLAMLTRR